LIALLRDREEKINVRAMLTKAEMNTHVIATAII
jgi:hypothetical protein